MAKKMISRLSVLTVLIVFLAACSKTVEYTNIIPADATFFCSLSYQSLIYSQSNEKYFLSGCTKVNTLTLYIV